MQRSDRNRGRPARAINDPRERPIIQPGDTLILQYKACEEAN